jgi:hypothetical protein
MTTAVLTVALGGGPPASGGITATAGQSVQLGATSTVGWNLSRAPIWTIVPSALCGLTVPAGWSTSGATFTFQGITPPAFTLPASPNFGKYRFKLDVYQLPVDQATMVNVVGAGGLHEVASGETNQFGADWTVPLNRSIHAAAGGGGSDGVLFGPTSVHIVQGVDDATHPQINITSSEIAIQHDAVSLYTKAGDQVAALDTSDTSTLIVGVDTGSTIQLQVNGATIIQAGGASAAIASGNVSLSASGSSPDGNVSVTGRFVQTGGTLSDGNETINVGTKVDWVFEGALTGDRTKTLGLTGVYDTAELVAYVVNTAAHTMAFVNGGTSGGTLITIANSTSMTLHFVYDSMSGDWFLATARKT